MRLSPTVERSDAAEALRLMQVRFAQHKWCKDQLRCLGKCSIVPSAQEELRLARLLHLCSGLGMPAGWNAVSHYTSLFGNLWRLQHGLEPLQAAFPECLRALGGTVGRWRCSRRRPTR